MTDGNNSFPDRRTFQPPDGFLAGSDADIAYRWVGGIQEDLEWQLARSPLADPKRIAESLTIMAGYEERLAAGDAELAAALARRATEEVEQLVAGRRLTVAGQARLLGERLLSLAGEHTE